MLRNTCALLLLAFVFAAGCDNGVGRPELDFTEFDSLVEAFLLNSGLEGASAVVVHERWGIVHSRGYGAFDADRLYLIASASKILSVGVLMRLADAGLVDMDAPIGEYVGEAWGPEKAELTLAQLLSNSSGMLGLLEDPTYPSYLCQYVSFGTLSSCARAIYRANDAETRVPPDTEFRYGGGPWHLAGGIAEHVSGKTWAELIEETYVEPCGAASLGYANPFSVSWLGGGGIEDGGLGYPATVDGDVTSLGTTRNPNIEGGGYITAQDYGAILLMHLRGGLCGNQRVLSAESVARMQEDRIGQVYGGVSLDPGLPGYGLGWWVSREEPGVIADPGAYGAMPWLDIARGYGAFIVIESDAIVGSGLRRDTKPALDAVFDAAAQR